MGKSELINDERFQTNDLRCKNYLPDLKNIIVDWIKR